MAVADSILLRAIAVCPDDWAQLHKAFEVAVELESTVDGRHYTEWAGEIRLLKKRGDLEGALVLCLACAAAVERAAMIDGLPMPFWYTEQAAIIYRKRHQLVEEIDVLHRYSTHIYGDEETFAARIARAFQLLDRSARAPDRRPPRANEPDHREAQEGEPWRTSKTGG